MKKITFLIMTLLVSLSGYSQFYQDFEEAVAPTSGTWVIDDQTWLIFDNGVGSQNWTINPTAFPAHQGDVAAFINIQNVGLNNTAIDFLVTPSVDLPANPQLRFWTRSTNAGDFGTIYQIRVAPVATTPDPTDIAAYTVIEEWDEITLTEDWDVYEEKVVPLEYPEGTDLYIAFVRVWFQNVGGLVGDRWLVDDVKVITECTLPTNLDVACLSTSASMSWDNPGITAWEVHVLPAGSTFPPASGTPLATTDNTDFVVTMTTESTPAPLAPLTDYDYYVRAVCTDASSEWVGPFECTTQAAPPECGGNFVDAGGTENYPANSNSVVTICPENPGDQVTVTFTSFNVESGWDGLYVHDGNSTSDPLIPSTNGPGNGSMTTPGAYWGTTIPGPFTSSSVDGCLTFHFMSDAIVQNPGWTANVTCNPPPTCPKPTALGSDAVTATTAELEFTNVGPATAWEYIIVPCGAPAPTDASAWIPVPSNPFTVSGLTSASCQSYYVRAICDTETSAVAGPHNFTTLVAPPECGGNFVDTGGISGNYSGGEDYTVTVCPEVAGDVVTVTFTSFTTEANYDGIYVHNGDSTADPLIPSANGPGFGAGVQVPGAYWGSGIPGPFESTSPDGCLTFHFVSDGIVQYAGWVANVTCAPPPTCPKPIELEVDQVTATSVMVAFTNVAPATEWEVIAVECGSPVPDDTAAWISATSNPFQITGLDPITCYNYYVRAICSPSDISIPAGPVTFTTQVAPPECGGTFTDIGGPAGNYPANSNSTVIICPENAGDVVTVTFTSMNTEGNYDGFYVYDGNSTSAPLIPSTNPAGFTGALSVPGAYWGNTVPPPFESTSADGCLTFHFVSDGIIQYAGWVANVTCDPAPTCPKPTALYTNTILSDSAIFGWTPVGPATSWEVIALPCGSPAPTDASAWISTTDNPVLMSDLTPDTCYNFYVRSVCSSTDVSPPTNPVTITTQVAPPVCDGIFVDQGGASGNYPSSSNSVVTICPEVAGEQVTVTFTSFNTEPTWDGFYIYDGNSTSAPLIASENPAGNGPMTSPGAFWGNEIPFPFTSSSADGCLTFHFLSDASINYSGWVANVTCDPPPTCPKPTAVEIVTTTGTAVEVGWTEVGFATQWHVLVLPATDPAPTSGTAGWQVATTNPYVYSPLTYGVEYKVYVRSFCSEDDISLWSNPVSFASYLPPIATSQGDYTTFELIEDVLLNSTCASVSNITWSTGSDFGSTNGIAYFEKNGSSFPFDEGVVLTTGNAMSAPGPNTSILGDGGFPATWPGDADLEAIILAATGLPMNSNNATILEFDFIPITNSISFNFIFASEEYGTFQCDFSDAFAFLLTDVAAATTTNLAVIPDTNTPVSVVTIRDNAYNGGCASVNASYFDEFYELPEGVNPLTAPINFNGVTVPLTASSEVTPGALYHIKLVIADRGDTAYDSAVFLEGGSFDIGNIELGEDFTQADGTALCTGDSYVLSTGLDPDLYTFEWTVDGEVIAGETGATITVTDTGLYGVSATYNTSTCVATDAVTIEFYPALPAGTPNNLTACNNLGFAQFNLDDNLSAILGSLPGADYSVTYHLTFDDADDDANALPTLYTNIVADQQTIFVRVENNITGCHSVLEFDLIVQDLTPVFTVTPDFTLCAGTTATITVTPGNYAPGDVTYSWTMDGADLPDTGETITINQAGTYIVTVNNSGCTATGTTVVTIGNITADSLPDVEVCDCFILPELSANHTYWTGTGGTGTQLMAGDCVTQTSDIFILAQSGDCTDETNFTVTVHQTPVIAPIANVTACDSYTLPTLTVGGYFSSPNGIDPINGPITGAGDHTVYVYAETGPGADLQAGTSVVCWAEQSFTVTIVDSPVVDPVSDVVSCGSF